MKTVFFSNALLDYLFRDGSSPKPAQWWLSLLSTMPDEEGLNEVEVNYAGYQRSSLGGKMGVPTGGEIINTEPVAFPMVLDQVTAVGLGLYSAAEGGTLLWAASFGSSVPIPEAAVPGWEPGGIRLAYADVAEVIIPDTFESTLIDTVAPPSFRYYLNINQVLGETSLSGSVTFPTSGTINSTQSSWNGTTLSLNFSVLAQGSLRVIFTSSASGPGVAHQLIRENPDFIEGGVTDNVSLSTYDYWLIRKTERDPTAGFMQGEWELWERVAKRSYEL
jgi:hypothetical protein